MVELETLICLLLYPNLEGKRASGTRLLSCDAAPPRPHIHRGPPHRPCRSALSNTDAFVRLLSTVTIFRMSADAARRNKSWSSAVPVSPRMRIAQHWPRHQIGCPMIFPMLHSILPCPQKATLQSAKGHASRARSRACVKTNAIDLSFHRQASPQADRLTLSTLT